MSTHLSRHFEEKRLARGLKPGHLAHLAGCTNIPKTGNRIRTFELSGHISQELFTKLATALEVDQATIERLVEQDRREFFEEWLQWVNEPVKPYLVIRLMAAVYSQRAMPPDITTIEQAETWAGSVAREIKKRCCLVWNRRISSWFNEEGELTERTEAVPGKPNVPWMKVGGKAFTFGADLVSVSQVNWPKRP